METLNITPVWNWNAASVSGVYSVYTEKENVHVRFYNECVCITDLTNTMKAGKTCRMYYLQWNAPELGSRWALREFLGNLPFSEFVDKLRAGFYKENAARLESVGINYTEEEGKGIRTFSPFVTVKPQKLEGKLTPGKVAKMILAGQIVSGVTNYFYTDDYYRDAVDNYREGQPVNPYTMARDIIEDGPRSWSAYFSEDKKEIYIGHAWDSYSLRLA